MQTHGKIEELKENLSQVFKEKMEKLEKYSKEKTKEINDEFKEKKKQIDSENEEKLKEEIEAAKERMENHKKLEATKQLQQKKEELINSVIDEIRDEAKKITKSKRYQDYLKKNFPQETTTIYADDDYSAIKSKVTKDKSIVGVKALHGDVVYDFTISSMINTNLEKLKETVAKELFK